MTWDIETLAVKETRCASYNMNSFIEHLYVHGPGIHTFITAIVSMC